MDKEKIKNYIYRLEIKIGLYFLAQCDEAKEEYRREVEKVERELFEYLHEKKNINNSN